MNKPQRVPLRLTALEMLEPRTPLHAGPPPSALFGDRGHEIFEQGPQPAPRSEHAIVSVSFSRPQRDDHTAPVVEQFASPPALSPASIATPVQIVIVITMPAQTTLTFTPTAGGQVSSVHVQPRSSSSNLRIAFPQLVVTRSPAAMRPSSLDSLSSLSALLETRSSHSDSSDGIETDSGEAANSPAEQTSSKPTALERNSARSAPTNEPPQQTQVATDDADELIDLDPDEEREQAKRKGTRAASSRSSLSSAREEFLRRENQFNALSLTSEHLPSSQRLGAREPFTLPANDDLIEVLADDQSLNDRGRPASAFLVETANTQLEATLGLATDVELLDESMSELAAAIAANSILLGSLPAAEPK